MGTENPAFEELLALRSRVFLDEMELPREFCEVGDRQSLHLLMRRDGKAAGCLRLARISDATFLASLPAVDQTLRGQGLGRALMEEAARKCIALGGEFLQLLTTHDAMDFFSKLGYFPTGAESDIDDLYIYMMERTLDEGDCVVEWILPGGDISDALEVRSQVFGRELGYTNDPDELDPRAHTLVLRREGQAVACGRVVALEDGRCKLGKVAVLPALRGTGVGRAVLENLEFRAAELGAPEVFLSSRKPMVEFYRHLGYQAGSKETMEGPEPHIDVTKTL